MCSCDMTEGITYTRFRTQSFANSSCGTTNGVLDFAPRLGPCIEGIKPLLGPSLDNRIRSILEEFVCKSNSNYAKRFPRVKRIVDMVAAWSERLDVSGKDTNVRQEMIKHAIEYLVKDGLVTQFADPVVLNSEPNKVEPDSLVAEQNALKNMNVWRFINEKDYWLCQDCATPTCIESSTDLEVHECKKETSSSDLDVEVGSLSQDPPISRNTCRTTHVCDPNRSQRNEDTKPRVKISCRNFEFVLEPNRNALNSRRDTLDKATSCLRKENAKKVDARVKFRCDTKSVQTQVRSTELSFIFKPVQTKLTPLSKPSEVPEKPKPKPRRERVKILNEETDCSCVQDIPRRSSKLKICINKTTSTSRFDIRQPSNVSNLSLPCKPSQLIVRIFEADPSLSDSCLILMRKKFEKDISNACSCMNDILKRLDDSMIKQLRLNCDIRPGRVDLNLLRTDGGASKVRWFLARVPTCSNVHKRDSCHGNISFEEPMDRCNEVRHSKDLPVDPACCGDRKKGAEGLEPPVAFYSVCSNHSLTEAKETRTSGNEIGKEAKGKEVNFVWSRKEKHVDFVFSPRLANLERNKDSMLSVQVDIKWTEERDTMASEICNTGESTPSDREEGAVTEACTKEEVVDERQTNDRFVTGDPEDKSIDSCDFEYSCSTDSLKEVAFAEDNSTTGGCNPDQCFCHVFCTNDGLDKHQRENVHTCPVAEDLNKDPDPCKTEDTVEGFISEKECDSKILISESRSISKMEEYSADSIGNFPGNSRSTEVSYDDKCSCCGKELSKPSLEEEPNLKTLHETSREVKDSSSPPCLEFKIPSYVADESNVPSTRDIPSKNIDHASDQKGKISSECSHVKDPPVTESLFVFYKSSNTRQTSSTANSSMDEESSRNRNDRARTPETNPKFESPCRRTVPSARPRTSIYPKTRNASGLKEDLPRVNRAKRNSRPKTKEEEIPAVPRYKNSSWRESMVPGNLCNSFPAIDRIKYLIRKKLRKLLMEERDKGTSTSKTFLRNDRYLVSISSGKLNEGRLLRESCSMDSSVRCPFTTRNRCEASNIPEKTFTEGSFLGRNKAVLGNIIKAGCQRMVQGNDVFKKIKMADVSRPRGCKYDSKSTDTKDLIRGGSKSKSKIGNGGFSVVSPINESQGNRSSIVSFNSSKMVSFLDDENFSSRRFARGKHRQPTNIRTEDFSIDSRSMRRRSTGKQCEHDSSGCLLERKENERTEGRIYCDKLRSFEKRLLKLERRRVVDNDFTSFLGDYEKRVNQLDADFRLKLLQYVTLCRNVKNSLMKRIQPDDVHEVSSGSV